MSSIADSNFGANAQSILPSVNENSLMSNQKTPRKPNEQLFSASGSVIDRLQDDTSGLSG